jgi:hypothetical protein
VGRGLNTFSFRQLSQTALTLSKDFEAETSINSTQTRFISFRTCQTPHETRLSLLAIRIGTFIPSEDLNRVIKLNHKSMSPPQDFLAVSRQPSRHKFELKFTELLQFMSLNHPSRHNDLCAGHKVLSAMSSRFNERKPNLN